MEFIHPELNEDISAIGGHYSFVIEKTILFKGRKVLYFIGTGIIDSSCCGVGGCIFALVPGYLISEKPDSSGRISNVDILTGEEPKQLFNILKQTENITQAVFLTEDGSACTII